MPLFTQTPLAIPGTPRVSVQHHGSSRRDTSAAIVAATILAFFGKFGDARGQAVQLVAVDVKAVGEGFQASKLTGQNVLNDKNEKIGTLDDLIVTKDRNLFGVLQVGGFLGIGGHLIAIPYDTLNISDDGRKITLAGASKESLNSLPEFHYKK
jgi:hypothetical protein